MMGFIPEYFRLQTLIAENPWAAWDDLRAFVRGGHPYLNSVSLVEDLVSLHGDEFLDVIEQEVGSSPAFAEAVAHMDISDLALTPTVERFYALQGRVRKDLGIDYWQGWLPLHGEEGPGKEESP